MIANPVYFKCGHKGMVEAPQQTLERAVERATKVPCPHCHIGINSASVRIYHCDGTSTAEFTVYIPLVHIGIELIQCGISDLLQSSNPAIVSIGEQMFNVLDKYIDECAEQGENGFMKVEKNEIDRQVRWEFEDQLPEPMDISPYFSASKVDGVRLYPYILVNGERRFLKEGEFENGRYTGE